MKSNLKALRELRRVVIEAPDERFDMRWVAVKTSCGTAHCAMGWANIDPWFIAQGLDRSLLADDNWGAFFGLTAEQGNMLFAGDINYNYKPGCISKREVLDNIDRLLHGNPARPYRAMLEGTTKPRTKSENA